MLADHLPVLRQSSFFAGFTDEEILKMLECFHATEHVYSRGETILRAGEPIEGRVYFIVEGNIDTTEEDFWGNETLLGRFQPGQIFGDAFILSGREALSLNAVSYRKTVVLMLRYGCVLEPCAVNCPCHQRLLHNLLPVFAEKVMFLLDLLSINTKRTLRGKLMSYLSSQAVKAGGTEFDIELNRQGLANYLAVDRSALSSELSRMQREGLITYKKNHFALHYVE